MMKKLLFFTLVLISMGFIGCKKDKIDTKTLLIGKWHYDKFSELKGGVETTTPKVGYYEFLEDGTLNLLDNQVLGKTKWTLLDDKTLSFEFAPSIKLNIAQLDDKNLVFYAEATSFGSVIRQTYYLSKPYMNP